MQLFGVKTKLCDIQDNNLKIRKIENKKLLL